MIQRIKDNLESMKVTPIRWLLSFSAIVMVRFFLEALSDPTSSGIVPSDAPTLVHYFLFFLFVSISIMLLLQYMIPTWKKAIPKLVLIGTIVTSIPPIIDWIVSGGKGLAMIYLIESPAEMFRSFITFFGSDVFRGATIGIRVEVILVSLALGLLVYLVRKSFVRAIFTAIAVYGIIFISGSMPGIISAVANIFGNGHIEVLRYIQASILQAVTLTDNIHGTLRYVSPDRMIETGFNFLIGRVFFVLTIVAAAVWFYTNMRVQVKAILSNLRLERIGHYMFLLILGVYIAYDQKSFVLNWNDWLVLITLLASLFFSCLYAISENDIRDVGIDRISNRSRPLSIGTISETDMRMSGIIFLATALFGAYLSGYYAFFCILAFNALYYVYSVPPTRFKRVPILSAFIIGLCSLVVVMAGFFTFSNVKTISAFPAIVIVGILVIFFLAQHIKDLKDIDGDRSDGTVTIPTMFGPVWGARVVGILVAMSYAIVPFIAGRFILFLGVVPAMAASYFIATRKPFKEWPIFMVYGLFAIFLAIVLVANI